MTNEILGVEGWNPPILPFNSIIHKLVTLSQIINRFQIDWYVLWKTQWLNRLLTYQGIKYLTVSWQSFITTTQQIEKSFPVFKCIIHCQKCKILVNYPLQWGTACFFSPKQSLTHSYVLSLSGLYSLLFLYFIEN